MNPKIPLIILSLLTVVLAGSTFYFFKQTQSLKETVHATENQMKEFKKRFEGVNMDDLPSETFTGDEYNAMKDRADFFEERCIQFTLLIPMIEARKDDKTLPQDLFKRAKEIESVIKKYGYWGKEEDYKVPALPYRKGIN